MNASDATLLDSGSGAPWHWNTLKVRCSRGGHRFDRIGHRADGRSFRYCSVCDRLNHRRRYWALKGAAA